jgi:transcriptional regulator GlxA family with amidase domain
MPLDDLQKTYNIQNREYEASYADISVFPLKNDNGQMEYMMALFIMKLVYPGRVEIERAKRYLENHWQDPFSLEVTAKEAALSKAHFSRLFKKHTGVTPRAYYLNFKMKNLSEKLIDPNLTVVQAFDACGLVYDNNSLKFFKAKFGVSPKAYKRQKTAK